MGVAGNKINFLAGYMKSVGGGGGNIFPPALGSFGIVNPGTGEKLKAKIGFTVINALETDFPVGSQGGNQALPVIGRNV